MGPFWLLRRGVKCLLAHVTVIIEYCKVCGREVDVVWRAPDELWARVVGNSGTIRCPRCFEAEAAEKGIWVEFRAVAERGEGD